MFGVVLQPLLSGGSQSTCHDYVNGVFISFARLGSLHRHLVNEPKGGRLRKPLCYRLKVIVFFGGIVSDIKLGQSVGDQLQRCNEVIHGYDNA